jgi:PmbA protein
MWGVAEDAVRSALGHGAQQCGARSYRVRDVSVRWRDGRLEQIGEATTRGVALQLYVDGRYSAVSSSDIRKEALDAFVADAIAMTRSLAPDPFRSLPDPSLYQGQADTDLQLADPAYAGVTAAERRRAAQRIEEAARSVPGARAILSVTTGFNDNRTESFRVHSNGFSGSRLETSFWTYAEVHVRDDDGRRPEEWSANGVRFIAELPDVAGVGRDAAERALARVGSRKSESAEMTMVVDNRSAARLVQAIVSPLSASSLQQKRSFYEGSLGQTLGSPRLTLVDDPFVAKGFGSRLFDAEGIAARKVPLFEAGVLRNFYVDTYYGKKLALAPTTGSSSNLVLAAGDKPLSELIADVGDGVLVTGFLGGNSNSATGDFSFGVQGFRVRGGRKAEPIAETNISGHLVELIGRLAAVGNDPYPYSTILTPTLVFEKVQFAGS